MLNNLWRNHGIAKEVTNILELGSGTVKFHDSVKLISNFVLQGKYLDRTISNTSDNICK